MKKFRPGHKMTEMKDKRMSGQMNNTKTMSICSSSMDYKLIEDIEQNLQHENKDFIT